MSLYWLLQWIGVLSFAIFISTREKADPIAAIKASFVVEGSGRTLTKSCRYGLASIVPASVRDQPLRGSVPTLHADDLSVQSALPGKNEHELVQQGHSCVRSLPNIDFFDSKLRRK